MCAVQRKPPGNFFEKKISGDLFKKLYPVRSRNLRLFNQKFFVFFFGEKRKVWVFLADADKNCFFTAYFLQLLSIALQKLECKGHNIATFYPLFVNFIHNRQCFSGKNSEKIFFTFLHHRNIPLITKKIKMLCPYSVFSTNQHKCLVF